MAKYILASNLTICVILYRLQRKSHRGKPSRCMALQLLVILYSYHSFSLCMCIIIFVSSYTTVFLKQNIELYSNMVFSSQI